jgi:CubicO group peptidase (beta-lactamase class C family)
MTAKLHPGTADQAGMSAERVAHIVDLARGWVEQGITPALVVLVARKGVVVLHEAFGRLGPEPGAPPLKRDTIFPMASLTKPITATAAMILVEDGLLGLNRPVQWYVPEFTGAGKDAVMVHHLLTHTSGLREEDVNAHAERKRETVEIPPPDETQHPRVHEYLFLRYDAPLWKPPGTEMSYCDSCDHELLGEIVRRVSGRSYADFCRERILRPLGMVNTYHIVPDSEQHTVVRRSADATDADVIDTIKTAPWACAGAWSTAMDMAIFGQMFLNRGTYGDARILSPASVAEMTRNQIPGISAQWKDSFFPEASWGLSWNILGDKGPREDGTLRSARTFAKGGAGGTFIWVDPVYEIVGIYFAVGLDPWFGCVDLYMNAVTAAVTDL